MQFLVIIYHFVQISHSQLVDGLFNYVTHIILGFSYQINIEVPTIPFKSYNICS